MCVYVGYILKTKPFLNLRFKFDWKSEKKLLILIIIIFKMYHSLTLKFIICLKLNNTFFEHGHLYRGEVWCLLKYKIWLTFFRDYSMLNLLKFD